MESIGIVIAQIIPVDMNLKALQRIMLEDLGNLIFVMIVYRGWVFGCAVLLLGV